MRFDMVNTAVTKTRKYKARSSCPAANKASTSAGPSRVGSRTDFTDSEAIAAIVRITGGNFRLLQRLFAQIGRLLTLNGLHTLTKEVVEAARECLIIGTT